MIRPAGLGGGALGEERSREAAALLVMRDTLCRKLEQTVEMSVWTSRITP